MVLGSFFVTHKMDPALFLSAESGAGMMRVFHRELMRGPLAQNAAILLFLGLLLVLTISVWQGLGSLLF